MTDSTTTLRIINSTGPGITSRPENRVSEEFGIVGRHPAVQCLRETIRRYAAASATVLVTGETGTGKELVARAIHTTSPRSRGPFVVVNMAALAPSLIATELFGHVRGAFTGAVTTHRGLFEQAHGGTIFLDEIGELAPDLQAMLLRVLETSVVLAVGGERARQLDVRVVAATNRDLAELVRDGRFRADLFYRLNVLTVAVPALRDRSDDIELLVPRLLARLRLEIGDRTTTPGAMAALAQYPWPGNIRQLINVLLRAAALGNREISVETARYALSLEPRVVPGSSEDNTALTANDWDRCSDAAVRMAIEQSGGRIAPAARRLKIARSTLRERLDRLGLSRRT